MAVSFEEGDPTVLQSDEPVNKTTLGVVSFVITCDCCSETVPSYILGKQNTTKKDSFAKSSHC